MDITERTWIVGRLYNTLKNTFLKKKKIESRTTVTNIPEVNRGL